MLWHNLPQKAFHGDARRQFQSNDISFTMKATPMYFSLTAKVLYCNVNVVKYYIITRQVNHEITCPEPFFPSQILVNCQAL